MKKRLTILSSVLQELSARPEAQVSRPVLPATTVSREPQCPKRVWGAHIAHKVHRLAPFVRLVTIVRRDPKRKPSVMEGIIAQRDLRFVKFVPHHFTAPKDRRHLCSVILAHTVPKVTAYAQHVLRVTSVL